MFLRGGGDEAPHASWGPLPVPHPTPREHGSLNQKVCAAAGELLFVVETLRLERGEAEMTLHQNLFVPLQDDSRPQGDPDLGVPGRNSGHWL